MAFAPEDGWVEHCVVAVTARPATFATAGEAVWKQAVRDEIARCGVAVAPPGLLAVEVEFRTPEPRTANEAWDIDNLAKPTLDAMDGVFGLRRRRGRPESDDGRVSWLATHRRPARGAADVGATVRGWRLPVA